MRAAQAACIPYFYKNSTTLAKELKPLAAQQAIEPGDLIWISGHVIIITNPKTGWCCEARDYGHGYGQTQQIHISKLFKDVQSLEQIKAAHLSGKPLTRINKNGESCRNYQVKILKLLA